MNEYTKEKLYLIAIMLLSVTMGVFLTMAYNNNYVNDIIEESALSYERAVNICKNSYNVDAELNELSDRFEFSLIEVKDE